MEKHYLEQGMISKDRLLERELLSSISPNSRVLDAGCGYDAAVISEYRNLVDEAVGVDLVEEFQTEPGVRTYTANLESLPFEDNYFDVIVSRDAIEHFTDPLKVFRELKRVLKPGGKVIIVTPNKHHYSSIISALLPTSFKKLYLRRVFGEDVYDNFPTLYRCNTQARIRSVARESGLAFEKLLAIGHHPYHLAFSVTLFRAGMLYDRLITKLGLDWLQCSFLFVLVKRKNDGT